MAKSNKRNIAAAAADVQPIQEPPTNGLEVVADEREAVPTTDLPRGKIGAVISLMMRPNGASLEELCTATGWMPHSVRGAISGNLKKVRGLNVVLTGSAGQRRYVIEAAV